jgi:hypothetical protein
MEKLYKLKLVKPPGKLKGEILHKVPEGRYAERFTGPELGEKVEVLTKDKYGRKLAVYKAHICYEIPPTAGTTQGQWMRVDKRDWPIVEAAMELFKRPPDIYPSWAHRRIGWPRKGKAPAFLDVRIFREHNRKLPTGLTVGYVTHNYYDLRLENLEQREPYEYLIEAAGSFIVDVRESARQRMRLLNRETLVTSEESREVLDWALALGEALPSNISSAEAEAATSADLRTQRARTVDTSLVRPLVPVTIPDAPVVSVEELFPETAAIPFAARRGNAINPLDRTQVDDRRAESKPEPADRAGIKKLG